MVTLTYHSPVAAGAIGQAQGASWQKALKVLEQHQDTSGFQQLKLELDSAGAHFGEPLEGLFYLNVIIEALWRFRQKGVEIEVHSPGWLYGGMAMGLASVAHRMTLGPETHMGLFGPKVLGHKAVSPIPSVNCSPNHLQLTRLTQ